MVRVLTVGQTPPPYRGAPIMLDYLLHNPMRGVDLRHMRIELSADDSQVGKFRWTKLYRLLLFIMRILYARIVLRPQVLYYAPAGFPRTTILRDAAVLCAVRPFFSKTVLHFHTCGYHELYTQLPGWQRWLFRRGIFHADGAIRLSTLAPDNGQNLCARQEYVVPNGVDDLGRDIASTRIARPITEHAPLTVLFVAALSESKGLWVLIDACAKMVNQGIPVRLHVMGRFDDGDFEAGTHRKVAMLKLNSTVRFLGELGGAAKIAAFAEADVLCHPTFHDAFPLVIVEAMACGLPVVATRWTSIPTIVDDGKTGYLVEPHNSDAAADRLACLSKDAELRVRMGAAGRRKFLREFTMTRHLERMRGVFLDVAGVAEADEKVRVADVLVAT